MLPKQYEKGKNKQIMEILTTPCNIVAIYLINVDGKYDVWFRDADAYPLKLVRLDMMSNGIVGSFGNFIS
jgi:hypothetical protein